MARGASGRVSVRPLGFHAQPSLPESGEEQHRTDVVELLFGNSDKMHMKQ